MEHAPSVLRTSHSEVRTGDVVEVRTRYQAEQWARGFDVAEVVPGGVRIRRRGTGEVLADVFGPRDVRPGGDG
jgi:hypothetical protein